ncbi:hypothetical protein E5672_19290 [Alteromonas portus]|uniref:Uncharacterized protein n=1 Tax=Alteromonas portus TaxID=2565549 RepID=A0A4U0Z581_9ALTE|nr:hypothetical protein [Alteromonas portus]TKB00811.1 hypothetical protein E5672_19290 [Alteromonas portus]
MSKIKLRPKSPVRLVATLTFLLISLQIASIIGQYLAHQFSIHRAIDVVERRISLDSAFLDVGNETLNTPANRYAIERYLERLEKVLEEKNLPVVVSEIQGVRTKSDLTEFPRLHRTTFENAEQTISISINSRNPLNEVGISWLSIILALLISPLFAFTSKKRRAQSAREEIVLPPKPRLVINLQEKTISNGIDDKVVTLQNKPLCFYTALVKYCIDNPNESLPPHKDVPHELMALANKCFGRLIELGHTKRKRPDFNANLDKTLSEIRAALDDVFTGYIDEKETYYPPRAQGEGSRSKQHSYALPSIKEDDIEIIGN